MEPGPKHQRSPISEGIPRVSSIQIYVELIWILYSYHFLFKFFYSILYGTSLQWRQLWDPKEEYKTVGAPEASLAAAKLEAVLKLSVKTLTLPLIIGLGRIEHGQIETNEYVFRFWQLHLMVEALLTRRKNTM